MPHKFGDTVVLVLRSRDKDDKDVFTRVNATVLHSVTQPDGAEQLSAAEVYQKRLLKGHNSKPLPGGEYLDLAYPNLGLVPAGQSVLTTRDPSLIFKNAHTVPPYSEGAVIGWEEPGKPTAADLDAVADEQKAKDATNGGKVRQIKGK